MLGDCRETLIRLWRCESGFVVSSELVLLATAVLIGTIVGLTALRDQLMQEFGDAAAAVATINQSYSFAAVTGPAGTVAGSTFQDSTDSCDERLDPPNEGPVCVDPLVQKKLGGFP